MNTLTLVVIYVCKKSQSLVRRKRLLFHVVIYNLYEVHRFIAYFRQPIVVPKAHDFHGLFQLLYTD